MFVNDNFYNFILSHRLPVSRGEKSVIEFLDSYYKKYIEDYKKALNRNDCCELRQECYLLLRENAQIIENLCSDIIKSLQYYDSGKMFELYNHFSKMMKKIEPYLMIRNINNVGFDWCKSLYRIRAGKESFERKDLFHIPMSKRHCIKSYRYSIPGYPCIYLSSGIELCWFECGMPKEFSYSSFTLTPQDDENLKYIDFTILPVDLISAVRLDYINRPQIADNIDRFILKYLVLFPLRVACSLEVSNRDVPFIEEYIFPQQLLLWVRENNNFNGILYRTSSAIPKARDWNYVNLVMPAKSIKKDYSEQLNELFLVTQPVKATIRDIFNKKQDEINIVNQYISKIKQKQYLKYNLYPYTEVLSICQDFVNLCTMLKTENYKNAEAIYHSMDTLILMSRFLCDRISNIKDESIKDGAKYYINSDVCDIENDFDETMNEYIQTINPIIVNFWSYAVKIGDDIDYSTAEHPIK